MIEPTNPYLAVLIWLLLMLYITVILIDAIWGKGRPREPYNP